MGSPGVCTSRGFQPESMEHLDTACDPMASFDKSTPFMLLARIHVKPGCVDQYLELARITDEAVQDS